jgi:hypothetical protein
LIGMKRTEDGKLIVNSSPRWAIDDTTREEANELLGEALREGYSIEAFAERLEERGLFADWRAELIARSELALAQVGGKVGTFKEAGEDRVFCMDGDDFDDECAARDQQIIDIEDAELLHPNAIFAGTPLELLGTPRAAFRAHWRGPALRLRTARGVTTISQNHPVLTGRGWIAAKDVRVGDYVVGRRSGDAVGRSPNPEEQYAPAEAQEVFDALREVGVARKTPASGRDFHDEGNFCEGEIDVVLVDGLLPHVANAPFVKQARELIFAEARPGAATLSRDGSLKQFGAAGLAAPDGSVSGLSMGRVRSRRADGYARFAESLRDDARADVEFCRDLADTFAVSVSLDVVLEVTRENAVLARAFDFHTSSLAYFAGAVLVHNCTADFRPLTREEREEDGDEEVDSSDEEAA